MSGAATQIRCDLRSEYDLACPNCGQAESLSIEISCTAILTIDGTEPCGDHYWDETSSCHCDECDHHGLIGEFRTISGEAVHS
jgi:hypothetical protein